MEEQVPLDGHRRRAQGSKDASNPNLTFAWVNVSETTIRNPKEASRIIHQHAMKEVGKKRRRRPRKPPTFELEISPLGHNRTLNDSGTDVQPSWWLGMRWTAGIGGLDPFVSYPVPIDAPSRTLIAYVFRDDDGQQRPLRDAWFTVGLQDEAAFYTVLSNSALHLNSMQKGGKIADETAESMQYQSRAIKSIMHRFHTLTEPGAVATDGLIGAVTGCMCHADILGLADVWKTHHKGLQEMVRLRGGIAQLERNEVLRVTISWCELRGALLSDTPPCFPLPTQWLQHASTSNIPRSPALLKRIKYLRCIWKQELSNHTLWMQMFDDLYTFSFNTFDPATGFPKDETTAGAWSNIMIHMFLRERPLKDFSAQKTSHSYRDAVILEVCRLAVLLYMVPVWRFFGVSPVISDILVNKVRETLDENDTIEWGDLLWPLKLWVLYIAGVEATRSPANKAWFSASIAQMMAENHLENWADVMRVVKMFLWSECLFKQRDEALENVVCSILKSSSA